MSDPQKISDQQGEQPGQDAAPARGILFMRIGESVFDVIGRLEAQRVAADWFARQADHGSDSA